MYSYVIRYNIILRFSKNRFIYINVFFKFYYFYNLIKADFFLQTGVSIC